MFAPYASEIWTKSYGPNYTKFWAFLTKKEKQKTKPKKKKKVFFFYNHIMTKCWRHFGRRFCSWNYCLMLELLIYRLTSFSVPIISAPLDTFNLVKSCTKHGRPDQSQRELTVALIGYIAWRLYKKVSR